MGEIRNLTPEGSGPLGRPRSGCENDIKMDLVEIGCGRGVWIEFVWIMTGAGGRLL
jgi:hypothetical protein